MKRLAVLYAVSALALSLTAAAPAKHRGRWVQAVQYDAGKVTSVTPVYLTTGAEVNAIAGSDIEPQQVMCVAWKNQALAGSGCSANCYGVGPLPAGMCCYMCPGSCPQAFILPCPGTSETGGSGQCIGARCSK